MTNCDSYEDYGSCREKCETIESYKCCFLCDKHDDCKLVCDHYKEVNHERD